MSDHEQKAFTTFEAAKICHVTHHSIKNWIKQGLIKASRTPAATTESSKKTSTAFAKNTTCFRATRAHEETRHDRR